MRELPAPVPYLIPDPLPLPGEDPLNVPRIVRLGGLLSLAALTLAAGSPRQDVPLAVVLQVDGSARVIREARDSAGAPVLESRSARVGDRLRAGERLEPQEEATVTVVTRAGGPETFSEPVFLEAADESVPHPLFTAAVDILDQAVTRARPEPNDGGRVAPVPDVPAPIAPRNGILVMEAQPRLQWFSVDGADEYAVQIQTPEQVPARYATADTVLVVPRALAPGRTYYWTVAVDGRASPEVALRTISDAEATAVVEGLAQVRALGLDPEGEGRLLKVILYAELGLFYAAAAELYAVEAQAGELGVAALYLKGQILDRLGRLDEAREAFDSADALAGASAG